jgi:alcohol dehydrogenase YqhD (iron-dependent ADH family)
LIITLAFEKNANLFTVNWQKSQKIVTITSTPGVQGCLNILKSVYQRELKFQLLIFGLFDVFVVLTEIVGCALASAYVAQVVVKAVLRSIYTVQHKLVNLCHMA